MTKFTKGPWVSFGGAIMTEDRTLIADTIDSQLPEDECVANCKVMHAAPELYEALQEAVDCLESDPPTDECGASEYALRVAAKCRAALATAEGK